MVRKSLSKSICLTIKHRTAGSKMILKNLIPTIKKAVTATTEQAALKTFGVIKKE